jgi:hypothetical protein
MILDNDLLHYINNPLGWDKFLEVCVGFGYNSSC